MAHISDWGILLARSDWDKPRTKGLTMFLLDMKSPGVEVRPIHQMSGDSEFNEVFLTDVRVPDSARLGGENDGWNVMLSTLMHERLSVGGALPVDLHQRLIALARQCRWDGKPAIDDARVRARIADAYLSQRGVDLIIMRGLTALSRGGMPGPEMAVTKLVAGKGMQDIASFAQEMAGAEGLLPAEELDAQWQYMRRMWLMAPGTRLGGGTDEILRNVIAERVLGLPGEVRTDKDVPFRELVS
jgi:alkylation response protein AidB-like acyl-CoA dehydrogenase